MSKRHPNEDGSYEKEQDLEAERRIAELICTPRKWGYHKMEKFDPVDFRCTEAEHTRGFLEVRVRNTSFHKWPTVWIAKEKWQSFLSLGQAFNVPVIFAVMFHEGVYAVDAMQYGRYETDYAQGRKNSHATTRKTDFEPVVVLELQKFYMVSENDQQSDTDRKPGE